MWNAVKIKKIPLRQSPFLDALIWCGGVSGWNQVESLQRLKEREKGGQTKDWHEDSEGR